MFTLSIIRPLSACLFSVALVSRCFGEEPVAADATPLTAERSVLVEITATVKAIDQTTREVTLVGPQGNSVTFVADNHIKRLSEVKVGDEVTAHYYVSIAGEVRAPTADEIAHPIQVVSATARAPKDADPAAGAVNVIKSVVTVQGLDLPTMTVTLENSQGQFASIVAKDVNKIKQLHLGDTIVVTYTEALAVSLDKVAPTAAAPK